MLTKIRNNLVISILGQVIIIGAMTQAVDIPVLVIFAIGLGLMLGGVFREIAKVQNQNNQATAL
jgi:predicted phage tail protein